MRLPERVDPLQQLDGAQPKHGSPEIVRELFGWLRLPSNSQDKNLILATLPTVVGAVLITSVIVMASRARARLDSTV